MLTLTYLVLAVAGCGYVAMAALLGHLGDAFGADHAGPGHGGDDAGGAYGVGGEGHGAASAAHGGASTFHFPFFSPLAVATIFGALGAWGLIARHGFQVGEGASLVIAVPLAAATAYAVTYAAWRLASGSRATSAFRLGELVGAPAEVLTPIPAGGTGEIAASVAGQRYTGPAREAEGLALGRGAAVTVVRVVGATLVVKASAVTEGARR